MFSYYGAKTNIVDLYPKPRHGKIIEPFAGSARYALKYFDRDVLLVDKYDVIIKIWKWLQQASEKDVLSMPRKLDREKTFDSFGFSEGQRLFFSFVSGAGDSVPRNIPTNRRVIDRPKMLNHSLKRVAASLFKIRHWKIMQGSYEQLPNEEATWFIDPPYQHGGYVYVENKINFPHLAQWSMERMGQVIVCENTKADWMDFKPVQKQRGSLKSTTEAIWCNHSTAYDHAPLKLF